MENLVLFYAGLQRNWVYALKSCHPYGHQGWQCACEGENSTNYRLYSFNLAWRKLKISPYISIKRSYIFQENSSSWISHGIRSHLSGWYLVAWMPSLFYVHYCFYWSDIKRHSRRECRFVTCLIKVLRSKSFPYSLKNVRMGLLIKINSYITFTWNWRLGSWTVLKVKPKFRSRLRGHWGVRSCFKDVKRQIT